MRERVIFVALLGILAVGIFGGIVSLSNMFAKRVPVRAGSFSEGIVGSPRFINPVLANSGADDDLTALVFSGLAKKAADGNPVPDLAESWTISPDGKTYSVILRPDLSFHDGKPLTSSDVAFTITKIQDPALKSPLRVAWEGVSVETPDDRTIVFSLAKPYAGFLDQLTVGILPEHIWTNIPDENWQTSAYNSEPVGAGSYRVSSVSRSRTGVVESVSLEAFGRRAGGAPYVKNMTVESFANTDDAEEAFASGSIDALSAVAPESVASLADSGVNVITTPMPRVFGLFLNPSKNKAFADQQVIKAINLYVDKQAIVDGVFQGYAHALSGPLPQFSGTQASELETRRSLAEKTLDNAGWKINPKTGIREKTIGKAVSPLTFSISTANTPELQATAQLVSSQLQGLGIGTSVKVFEIGTLNQSVIRARDFEGLLFGEIVRHDTDIYAFWHSSQKSDPGLNITGTTNKTIDAELESALRETDPAKRMAIYQNVSTNLAASAPVVFLYSPDFVYLVSKSIQNVSIPAISDPSDRFSAIGSWYIETDRVWNMLTR